MSEKSKRDKRRENKKKEEIIKEEQQQLSRDSTYHVKSHDNKANRREHQARKQEILQINMYVAWELLLHLFRETIY